MQTHDRNPNSGLESLPPRVIFPKGDRIKKKIIRIFYEYKLKKLFIC